MSFESVRDELYALPPDAFIAARTEAEKAARRAGDRDTANAIKALGKPTVVAWLANQLVRAHRDEIGPLLDLGAELREATRTLSGEQLRTLSQQQHQVIMALVRQGRAIARSAGQQMTDATATGLEETLRAALADESLAAQLSEGALTTGLRFVGFGLMGGEATAPAGRAASARPVKAPDPTKATRSEKDAEAEAAAARRAEELEQAEQAVARARDVAEQAFDVERHNRSAKDDADAAARSAGEAVADLEQRLEEARARRDEADAGAEQARKEHDQAQERLEEARRDLEQAENRERELRAGG